MFVMTCLGTSVDLSGEVSNIGDEASVDLA